MLPDHVCVWMLPDHTHVCVCVSVCTCPPSPGIADSYGSFIPSFLRNLHCCCLVAKSHSTLCNPMDYNRFMEFFRQEYWSGFHLLLWVIFLTQRLNLHLLHLLNWQADSLPPGHVGSPTVMKTIWYLFHLICLVNPLLLVASIYLHYCKHGDIIRHGPKRAGTIFSCKKHKSYFFFIMYHLIYIL